MTEPDLARFPSMPQHGPRPLPLFLDLLCRETIDQPDRRAAALAGLRAYQQAERSPPRRPPPPCASAGRATLHDYGGSGRPVLLVPSLINPPFVLDLAPGQSLTAFLRAGGCHCFTLDWGTPTPHDRDQDITAHVETLLLPLLDALLAAQGEPPIVIGYCLGGTLALAAACARRVAGLALIAAPWHFRNYGPARDTLMTDWRAAAPLCEQMGLMPMEVLQAGFWRLDPARTIAKYERFATLEPEAARAFLLLEDWANSGAPLSFGAGRQLFEGFFYADQPGKGEWRIDGVSATPAALTCPAIEFVSLTDRIVPAAAAAGLRERREISAGHVGMMVGSRAQTALWQPLLDWISKIPPLSNGE